MAQGDKIAEEAMIEFIERIIDYATEKKINGASKLYISKGKSRSFINIKEASYDKCIVCGSMERITTHHIIPKRMKCEVGELNELCIKLCVDCHKKIDDINVYIQAVKQLSKMLMEMSEGEVRKSKDFIDIQKSMEDIDITKYNFNKPLRQKLTIGEIKTKVR